MTTTKGYDRYIPERNYPARDYRPFGGPFEDMCGHCKDYYAMLYEKGLTSSPFPINCAGHITDPIKALKIEDFDSIDGYTQAIIALDPVAWALYQFNWMARWYQEEALSCLNGSSLIYMADGSVKEVRDVKAGDEVITYDEVGRRTFPKKVLRSFSAGVKKLYRIVLNNGDSLECTSDHPIYSWSKCGKTNPMLGVPSYKSAYRSIDDGLAVGDRLFVLNRFDRYSNNDDPDLAALLGYMVTDGCMSKGRPSFTNTRHEYIEEFISLVKRRFPSDTYYVMNTSSREYRGSQKKEFWTVGVNKGEFSALLHSIGCKDKTNRELSIVDFAFGLSEDSLRIFINRCWSGDGCVYTNSKGVSNLSFHSGNEEYLNRFRFLLRKLGINSSRIYTRHNKEGGTCKVICISKVPDVVTFFSEVGPVFGKTAQSRKSIEANEKRGCYTSKRRFKTTSRFKIKSIEFIGEGKVFDLTIEDRPNFFANGMVVHNCTSRYKVMRWGRRCLSKGTLVATPKGPMAIENIKEGDTVYSEHEEEIPVLKTFKPIEREIVDIVHEGKILATCSPDHRWLSVNPEGRYIIPARGIFKGTHLSTSNSVGTIDSKYVIALKHGDRRELCYDIEVDSPSHLYVLESGLITHNSGKSEMACIALLHKSITNTQHSSLVLAPYEAQISNLFKIIHDLIDRSKDLNDSISRSTLNPHRLEFHNGSSILGFSAGSKTAARSDKIRGHDAHFLYIDEFDYIPDSDVAAVTAILMSHPNCGLWATSTPTGEHRRFYGISTDKNLGYKESWITSMELPHWNEQLESEMRREYNAVYDRSPEWDHEVLAEFSSQIMGVFRNKAIDESLDDYELGDSAASPGGFFILGVDWNKIAGTHMVIVQFSGNKFTLVDKIVIPRGEFTQTTAVSRIIELHDKWDFRGLYVDVGFGSTQIELLKKHGMTNPGSNIHLRLRGLAMQQMTEVRDPTTGAIVKKHTKPFLVNQLVRVLDEGMLVLPKSEDTRVVRQDMDMGIVQQMRNFRIEGYSVHGLPKYSQGQDHTLTALMLAIGGFSLDHGDLVKSAFSTSVAMAPGFGEEDLPADAYDASDILRGVRTAAARDLEKGKPMMGFANDASSIRSQYKARRTLDKSLDKDSSYRSYITRRNITRIGRKNV